MAQSAARPDWSGCLRAKDPEQRVQACTFILNDTRDPKIIVRALNGRGNALCATIQRCAEAVPDFTSVVKSAPTIAGYHDNLARALRAASRYEDALRVSDRAIALASKMAFVYVGKAKTLAAAGRGAEAHDVVRAAMGVVPVDGGLIEYDGKLLGDLRRFPESYAAFDQALRIQPTRAGVYVRRADVELAEGRIDDAIHDLERYPSDGDEADAVHTKLEALRGVRDEHVATIHEPAPYKSLDRVVGGSLAFAAHDGLSTPNHGSASDARDASLRRRCLPSARAATCTIGALSSAALRSITTRTILCLAAPPTPDAGTTSWRPMDGLSPSSTRASAATGRHGTDS